MKFSMFSPFSRLARSQRAFILYRVSVILSRTFLTFRSAFSVHFHASHCLFFVVFVPACLPDSLIILPKIYTLVNAFFYLFLTLFLPFSLPPFPCLFQVLQFRSRHALICILRHVLSLLDQRVLLFVFAVLKHKIKLLGSHTPIPHEKREPKRFSF